MNAITIVKPKFKVVKIDESEFWDKELVNKTNKIYGVYLYDESRYTFCCETIPSYEMHFLNSVADKLPSDEFERENILDELYDGDIHTERLSYKKVSYINNLPKENKANVYDETYQIDEDEYDTEKAYRTLLKETIAEECANPNFS